MAAVGNVAAIDDDDDEVMSAADAAANGANGNGNDDADGDDDDDADGDDDEGDKTDAFDTDGVTDDWVQHECPTLPRIAPDIVLSVMTERYNSSASIFSSP